MTHAPLTPTPSPEALAAASEAVLVALVQQGGPDRQAALAALLDRLVPVIRRRIRGWCALAGRGPGAGDDRDDLLQVAHEAAIRAIGTYDATRGTLEARVGHAVNAALQDLPHPASAYQTPGRDQRRARAGGVGWSPVIREALSRQALAVTTSLEGLPEWREPASEPVLSEGTRPEAVLALARLLAGLEPVAAEVMCRLYGLGDQAEQDAAEVAEAMGLTHAEVRRIAGESLRAMAAAGIERPAAP